MKLRESNIIVYCRGDEKDDVYGHPLTYLYKEGRETFCPYCNKLMKAFKSDEESKPVEDCTVKVVNKIKRIRKCSLRKKLEFF